MTAPETSAQQTSSQPLVSRGWIQGVALVMIFGFLVMGILAYRTYSASMPMPDKVVSESGRLLFTGADITRGQELYQARGLMEYGSVLGHGAYLGPLDEEHRQHGHQQHQQSEFPHPAMVGLLT